NFQRASNSMKNQAIFSYQLNRFSFFPFIFYYYISFKFGENHRKNIDFFQQISSFFNSKYKKIFLINQLTK
ncbi:hypothetical protein, partial [Intestinibacter bartlettii]|uniref:hypothetical protein n=1 Tax=Intestinibacter bartlettii TaxID=261299 RepID=UPI00399614B9